MQHKVRKVSFKRPVVAQNVDPLVIEIPFGAKSLAYAEREIIIETLKRCRWSKKRTARILGISRMKLYRAIYRYDIQFPKKPENDEELKARLEEEYIYQIKIHAAREKRESKKKKRSK